MDSVMVADSINGYSIDWSMIIAILALLGSGFTFWFYDRKTKKQDARINEYLLRNFEDEETTKKKAQVKGNMIKEDRGKRTLKVFNAGKAIARNIRIEYLSDMNGVFISNENLFPYEMLNPQDSTEIHMVLTTSSNDTLKIRLLWDDEYQKNNFFEQVLTL